MDRLTRQLAVWVAQRTGKWQIVDDLERMGLQPLQAFERLGHSVISGSYIVLDDCHRATDAVAFELLCDLTSRYWQGTRLILLSEHKIPAAAALGAREIPLGGLSPRESLLFVTNLGLDVSDSVLQFATLSVQVDGHPIMLRAIAKELPPRPSSTDVLELGQRIPSITAAEAFLGDLSNRIFYDLLRTQDQRFWVARLAAVGFPVTEGLALRLAQLQPPLQILTTDWIYLKSLLLDEIRAGHYSVPALLGQIAGQSISLAERQALSLSAARYVFQMAIASRIVDFWDFQHALFALLGTGHHDEAAMRFVHSFAALMRMNRFKPLELLFLTMNNEQTHAKIKDPGARWLMLQFEVQMRAQGEDSPNQHRLLTLIRRMRALLITPAGSIPTYGHAMLYLAIASVRIRAARDSQVLTEAGRYRIFATLHAAIRAALDTGDLDFLANLLRFYDHLYSFAARPNVELLKDALLKLPRIEPLPMSQHALIGIYSRYVSDSKHSEAAMRIVESHGGLFREEGRNDAYFACEHAAAMILHDGRASYRQARERIVPLMSRSANLQLAPQSLVHGLVFIAGTYWAEGNYAESAEYYQKVLHADFGTSGLHQIVCERLCDSLIFLGKYESAARIVLTDLRSRRADQSPEQRARLYGRLAYAYTKHGALKKAAISCLGLCRVATESGSDALDLLAATVTGWVLGHFTYSDPAIPQSTTKMIRDSNALSDAISSEELKKWRDADPFRTRGVVLAATLFELLEDWCRSEYLYRRALGVVLKSNKDTKSFRQTAHVYLLRLARTSIRVRRLEEAAHELKQALEYAIDIRRQEQPQFASAGAGVYALLKMADHPLRACSDEDVIRFFDLLNSQFASDIAVRAWMSYRESEILFERFAVQAAKRRLGEAMELAQSTSEYELYWLVVQNRLFYRAQQIYGRQEDWLRDAIEVALALASDDNFAQYHRSFAELVVPAVGAATEGPFMLIASAVKRLGGYWEEHGFLVAAYAIWRAGTNFRILSGSRIALGSILRAEAAFLGRSDFD